MHAASLLLFAFVPSQPLFKAVERDDAEAVKRLLARGVDPNARESFRTSTNLRDGIEGGRTQPGDTPLTKAAEKGSVPILRLLLKAGAPVDSRGIDEETALSAAVKASRFAAAALLLDHGASVNASDSHGYDSLSWAAYNNDSGLAKLLLQRGADANGSGYPLWSAAFNGWTEMVELLLASGAKPDAGQRESLTPLEAALENGHDQVAELLLEAEGKTWSREKMESEQALVRDRIRIQSEFTRRRYQEEFAKHLSLAKMKPVFDAVSDAPLFNAALDSLSTNPKGAPNAHRLRKLLLMDSTLPFTSESELNGNLSFEEGNAITLSMRRELLARNGMGISLKEYHPKNSAITIGNYREVNEIDSANTKLPWDAYVQLSLPALDPEGDRAVFRFTYGATKYRKSGTMLLTRQNGKWRVKWRKLGP